MKLISSHSIVLLSLMILVSCSKQNDGDTREIKAPLKPVRTMVVSVGSPSQSSIPGVVDAVQSAEIGFRVSGELEEVLVTEGQEVSKGQVLAKLDQTDFKISLQAAKSEYKRASLDFKRAKKLKSKGVISQADIDKLRAQASNAKAQKESAEQNLKYTVLKAPFDGVVAKVYLSNFEKVSSAEKFAVIHDLSAFEVSVDIPESIMIKLRREDDNRRQVYATFFGVEERKFPLRLKEVSTRADEKTQTYRVTMVMDSPEGLNVLPGMSVTVYATLKRDRDSDQDVYVPAHAVLEDSSGRFVYTVALSADWLESGLNKGFVERRSVVVGKLNENGIQIVQGLHVGDHVITAGMSKVNKNMEVRLMDGKQ